MAWNNVNFINIPLRFLTNYDKYFQSLGIYINLPFL